MLGACLTESGRKDDKGGEAAENLPRQLPRQLLEKRRNRVFEQVAPNLNHLDGGAMRPQSDSAGIVKKVWSLQSMARVEAQAQKEAQALVEAMADARVLAKALAWARAGARAGADAEGMARLRARMQTRARAGLEARAEARTLGPAEPMAYKFTYPEILADPNLKDIIYCILPYYRHRLTRHLCRHSHTRREYWWLIQIIVPITRLPQELLQQIFIILIDKASGPPLVVMLVCKYWYTIVTGLWASLHLGTRTPKDAVTRKLARNQWLLDVSVDTTLDSGDFTPSEGDYEAIVAAIEACSRWRSFVVETFPARADLPDHLVHRGLERFSDAAMSRLRTFKIKCTCEMSPLLDCLLRILGTTASGELTTVEINSASVISLLAPTYSSIFSSVKNLSLDTPGLPGPVDLLPHLYQLEAFTASHLSLPIYHNDIDLPFVHTLRHLRLRAVSIQWMSDRTFHALESCVLLFPRHYHVMHTFSTTLPNCSHLTFQGYPLNILDGVSAHALTHLAVTSSCSYKPRGNRQLVRFSSHALRENALAPRILHISIEATAQAWTQALPFMSYLEELVIDNAHPSSLGVKVLQSLVVKPVDTHSLGTTTTPGGVSIPTCPSLERFGLRYRRWLRPSEHFELIPEFMSIIWSRQQSKFSLRSFRVWTRSDQNPLELIDGSRISLEGFERLANDGAIKERNLLESVVGRLVENTFKYSRESSVACP
jgi:hypothetical protein